MAVNFHQPSVYALFDAMPVPLLTFAVSGLVTYANPAAKQHPGRPVETMSGNPVIKSLVAAATLGKLKLPYTAKIELAEGHHLAGQFMSGPAGLDIAFLAASDPDGAIAIGSHPTPMKLKNVIELLRDELGPPMNLLMRQLQTLPVGGGHAGVEMASQALGQRLMRLADLIEVFGNEVLETGDRIEPLELIREVCAELGPRAEKMGVRFDIVEPRETLPPVYGNRKLIGRAFHECLENALVHSRKEVSSGQLLAVEIRFTLSGEHVLVAVRNRGASTLRIGGQDAPRPFVAPPPGGSDSVPRLGLPLVQRIVSLHGGNLRLSAVDEDTTQVLMEFPTGAPLRGQEQLGITQAQRYAKDLAQLMSRRKKEKA
jgi:two-component sensor histidine kinase